MGLYVLSLFHVWTPLSAFCSHRRQVKQIKVRGRHTLFAMARRTRPSPSCCSRLGCRLVAAWLFAVLITLPPLFSPLVTVWYFGDVNPIAGVNLVQETVFGAHSSLIASASLRLGIFDALEMASVAGTAPLGRSGISNNEPFNEEAEAMASDDAPPRLFIWSLIESVIREAPGLHLRWILSWVFAMAEWRSSTQSPPSTAGDSPSEPTRAAAGRPHPFGARCVSEGLVAERVGILAADAAALLRSLGAAGLVVPCVFESPSDWWFSGVLGSIVNAVGFADSAGFECGWFQAPRFRGFRNSVTAWLFLVNNTIGGRPASWPDTFIGGMFRVANSPGVIHRLAHLDALLREKKCAASAAVVRSSGRQEPCSSILPAAASRKARASIGNEDVTAMAFASQEEELAVWEEFAQHTASFSKGAAEAAAAFTAAVLQGGRSAPILGNSRDESGSQQGELLDSAASALREAVTLVVDVGASHLEYARAWCGIKAHSKGRRLFFVLMDLPSVVAGWPRADGLEEGARDVPSRNGHTPPPADDGYLMSLCTPQSSPSSAAAASRDDALALGGDVFSARTGRALQRAVAWLILSGGPRHLLLPESTPPVTVVIMLNSFLQHFSAAVCKGIVADLLGAVNHGVQEALAQTSSTPAEVRFAVSVTEITVSDGSDRYPSLLDPRSSTRHGRTFSVVLRSFTREGTVRSEQDYSEIVQAGIAQWRTGNNQRVVDVGVRQRNLMPYGATTTVAVFDLPGARSSAAARPEG